MVDKHKDKQVLVYRESLVPQGFAVKINKNALYPNLVKVGIDIGLCLFLIQPLKIIKDADTHEIVYRVVYPKDTGKKGEGLPPWRVRNTRLYRGAK